MNTNIAVRPFIFLIFKVDIYLLSLFPVPLVLLLQVQLEEYDGRYLDDGKQGYEDVEGGLACLMVEEDHGAEASEGSEYETHEEHESLGHALTLVVGQVLVPCKEQEGEYAGRGQQIYEVFVDESDCLRIHRSENVFVNQFGQFLNAWLEGEDK